MHKIALNSIKSNGLFLVVDLEYSVFLISKTFPQPKLLIRT